MNFEQWHGLINRFVQFEPPHHFMDRADARRGWAESQVCCFTHLPGGWDAPVTIAARRWRFADELPGMWRTLRVRSRVCGDAAGAG